MNLNCPWPLWTFGWLNTSRRLRHGGKRVGGPWTSVGRLIELFSAMGCVLSEVPNILIVDEQPNRVRYLYSPETDDFVSLRDLTNDDLLPPSEVENWERRLGITIPKGETN